MSNKIISAFLWAWKNYEAGDKSLRSVRKFYPDADLFIQVDHDGDVDNYTTVANKLHATVRRNSFQLGYCGNFGNVDVGRTHWPKTHSFEWLNNFYNACTSTDSKYILILEEDDFVLNPITVLHHDISIAIHPTSPSPIGRYRPNQIDERFFTYSASKGGVTTCPGYASGGGTIVNREHYIIAWDKCRDYLWNDYELLETYQHIIGWQDFIVQYVMMLGGFEVVQNHRLCEHWEVGEKWNTFEIVTGLKDHRLVQI